MDEMTDAEFLRDLAEKVGRLWVGGQYKPRMLAIADHLESPGEDRAALVRAAEVLDRMLFRGLGDSLRSVAANYEALQLRQPVGVPS